MFFTLLDKLPFFHNLNPVTSLFVVFILASVLYILLHRYLYAQSAVKYSFIEKYKSNIYFFILIDFIIFVMSKNQQISNIKNKKTDDNEPIKEPIEKQEVSGDNKNKDSEEKDTFIPDYKKNE